VKLMGFVKVKLKPQNTILLWFVWKSNPNVPLEGYFLGIVERKNGDKVDKAIVVYDDESDRAWVAYLKGALWTAPWHELVLKRVRITYWQSPNKKGFELEYDPEDTLAEPPELRFAGKFEGFKFVELDKDIPF